MYQLALSVLIQLQAMLRPGNSAQFRAALLNSRYGRKRNSQKNRKLAFGKGARMAVRYRKRDRNPGLFEYGGPAGWPSGHRAIKKASAPKKAGTPAIRQLTGRADNGNDPFFSHLRAKIPAISIVSRALWAKRLIIRSVQLSAERALLDLISCFVPGRIFDGSPYVDLSDMACPRPLNVTRVRSETGAVPPTSCRPLTHLERRTQ
jgi:hypothetical protein